MLKHKKKTKIIATIGPSTEKQSVLRNMISSGVDIFRINFSHGEHAVLQKSIDSIRVLNKEMKTCVGILGDLQGPKLRIGKVKENNIILENEAIITITNKEILSNKDILYLDYPYLIQDIKKGETVLIDDGKIELQIIEYVDENHLQAKVIQGGNLSSHKGFNIPYSQLQIENITQKDREDLTFALKNNLDWIALSFVQESEDIIKLRSYMGNRTTKIIAKIEKPKAIEKIDTIIQEADGIMVARGDLGVEMNIEKVPIIQKQIVEKCLASYKPVIIATQMMESMISQASPTRAEVNDVANAVIDGADAVMLSAETSIGEHPIEVIRKMTNIIKYTENNWDIYNKNFITSPDSLTFLADNICLSAVYLAKQIQAKAIISITNSGYTAYKIASHRPSCKIFIFTSQKHLLTQLNLLWNVQAYYYDKKSSTDETITDLISILKKQKEVNPGDLVINTCAMPIHVNTKTNTLKISTVS